MNSQSDHQRIAHISLVGDQTTGNHEVKFDYPIADGVVLPSGGTVNSSIRIPCADGYVLLRIHGDVIYDLDVPNLTVRVVRSDRRIPVTDYVERLQTNPRVQFFNYQPQPRPGARTVESVRDDVPGRPALGSSN